LLQPPLQVELALEFVDAVELLDAGKVVRKQRIHQLERDAAGSQSDVVVRVSEHKVVDAGLALHTIASCP
jgi:hypothetical protein